MITLGNQSIERLDCIIFKKLLPVLKKSDHELKVVNVEIMEKSLELLNEPELVEALTILHDTVKPLYRSYSDSKSQFMTLD